MRNNELKPYVIWQKVIKLLGSLALVGSFLLAFWFYRLGILNDSNGLKDLVHSHKVFGPLVFVGVQIVQIVFPIIPGGMTTIAGFLIFGPLLGFLYNYVGIFIGSVILFLLVKTYGRRFILLFIEEQTFYKYERKLETPYYERLFILCMLSPISPADIMVMITGLTEMSLKRFVTIILITKPLSIIGYSYLFIFGKDLLLWFFH
ncbi:TPA: TVP38/TMEM64 family protein [Streptococcus equi subsp. zooepidemicus]|uniref:TVP38/TMEM64 family protein n=1 Tax=Streptococcus equi TaxID=1336 RepID=UPI001E5222CB|nr:TVP38/TMEM64 family protein [Streptococcus equi]MCD3372909.1 TVP38/TMEM64 family protein [Streptococcus equi subsp. zooepidemicus]HEL0008921.1 TVP38/TMEM64 family protein [Streptococcus equi subsp. zooepidemicus]HEL0010994.1 TVP38/TMEM64 family protein [Streptococcus equi subsp. zooepidemicus]HEL0013066.1 TVP38/TMEM64 family protein [Streptococcus equi subsp. zooepidemicus]HEL0017173.1 TVP38/TMEM64 family protein [Streptococcus equi subsp. zooepidemicus]